MIPWFIDNKLASDLCSEIVVTAETLPENIPNFFSSYCTVIILQECKHADLCDLECRNVALHMGFMQLHRHWRHSCSAETHTPLSLKSSRQLPHQPSQRHFSSAISTAQCKSRETIERTATACEVSHSGEAGWPARRCGRSIRRPDQRSSLSPFPFQHPEHRWDPRFR